MEKFTPYSGFAGGLLIGGAASLFILLTGRVAGISGILGGVFGAAQSDLAWRFAFVSSARRSSDFLAARFRTSPSARPCQ